VRLALFKALPLFLLPVGCEPHCYESLPRDTGIEFISPLRCETNSPTMEYDPWASIESRRSEWDRIELRPRVNPAALYGSIESSPSWFLRALENTTGCIAFHKEKKFFGRCTKETFLFRLRLPDESAQKERTTPSHGR
jgi:hypothetical protein